MTYTPLLQNVGTCQRLPTQRNTFAFSRPMLYRVAASSPLSVSGDTEARRLAYSGPSILTDWRVRFFLRKSLQTNGLAASSKGIYKPTGLYNLCATPSRRPVWKR